MDKNKLVFSCFSMLSEMESKTNDRIWHKFAMNNYKYTKKTLLTADIDILASARSEEDMLRMLSTLSITNGSPEELEIFQKYLAKEAKKYRSLVVDPNEEWLNAVPDTYVTQTSVLERQPEHAVTRPFGIRGRVEDNEHVQSMIKKLDAKIKESMFLNPEGITDEDIVEYVVHILGNLEDELWLEKELDKTKLFSKVMDRYAYPTVRYGDMFIFDTGKKEKDMFETFKKAYENFKKDIIVELMLEKMDDEGARLIADFENRAMGSAIVTDKNNTRREKPEKLNIFNLNRMIREESGDLLAVQAVTCMMTAWNWERKRDILIRWFDDEYKLFQKNIQIAQSDTEEYEKKIADLKAEIKELKRQKEEVIASAEETRKSQSGKLNRAHYEINSLKAENEKLKETIEQIKGENPGNDTDRFIIDELKFENKQLNDTITLLRQNADRDSELVRKGREKELFPDEQYEILMDTLESALTTVPEKSRRYDVIKSILDENPYQNVLKKNAEILKNALTGYTKMTAPIKKDLNGIGIVVESEAGHYKMTYYGDQRYMSVIAKTPSDKHAGANNAHDAKKLML